MGLAMAEAGLEPAAIDYVSYRGTAPKSIIGHPQSAFGAAGLAATLLAMRDGAMHGTLHLDSPDPARKIDAEHAVCNYIAFGNKNSALVAGCG